MIRKHIKVSIVWHVWFCCGLASRDKLQIAQIARAVQLLRVNFSLTVRLHFEKKQISFIFIPLCGISWYYTAWHCSPPCDCVSSLLVWQRSSTFKTAIQYLRTASGPHVQVLSYNWKYFYRNRMSTACDWKTLFKQDVFIYTSVLRLLCWKDKLNTRMQTNCKVILLKSSRHFMKTWLQLIFLYFVWPNKKLNNSTDKGVDDFNQNSKRLFVKYLLPFKGRKTKTRKFSELAL